MSGVNKVILLGRLGKDPVLEYTPNGNAVCKFSIATSKQYKDKQGNAKEKSEWHNIIAWSKLAETCNTYLAKGREVYIEGELETTSWEDKKHGDKRYKTEVVAYTVQFIGPRDATKTAEQPGLDVAITTDDIPF